MTTDDPFDLTTTDEQKREARRRLGEAAERSRYVWPIRTPRGLDAVIAALPPTMSHSARVALLNAPLSDLDGATPVQWLRDDGAAALVIAALTEREDAPPAVPVPHLVRTLTQALGRNLVAYIASARETSTVRAWESHEAAPSSNIVVRLSATFHVIDVLRTSVSDEEIQVWMQGRSEMTDGVAPARLLRDGPDITGLGVLAAAREHVARRRWVT